VGRPAPPVPGIDYAAADRTVLAFVAPGCDRCEAARAAVSALGPTVQSRIVEGDPDLFAAFDVRTPPVVLIVDRSGTVVEDEVPSALR
jgi:glutaredoxin